jgi:hypothetical protein
LLINIFSRWRILNRICTWHPQDFHIRGRHASLPAVSAGAERRRASQDVAMFVG